MVDRDIATDETERLIASNKIEGTAVYNRDGEKLGSIYNFMVDKGTGRAEYAVLTFGGFLGVGTDYYPLPWDMLAYDVDQGGYVVDIDKAKIEGAPHYASEEPRYERAYGEQVHGYYGLTYPIV